MDHVRMAATAKRLIDANGRPITLVQLDMGPADVNKPWDGDPTTRGSPTSTLSVIGLFGIADTNLRLGMADDVKALVKRSDRLIYIGTTADLSIYNEVLEADGTRWAIMHAEALKPGLVGMLWWLAVKR